MKMTSTFLAAIVLLGITSASADELTIVIEGYSSASGKLMVAIFDNQAAYDRGVGAYIALQHAPVIDGHQLVFGGLAEGDYAIKAFHDANGNSELDSNLVGIPTESYDFSGSGGRTGPPDFDEAKVSLRGDATVNLDLR